MRALNQEAEEDVKAEVGVGVGTVVVVIDDDFDKFNAEHVNLKTAVRSRGDDARRRGGGGRDRKRGLKGWE